MFLVYGAMAFFATRRGYKSPLLPAIGFLGYLFVQFIASLVLPKGGDLAGPLLGAILSVPSFAAVTFLLLPARNPREVPKKSTVDYGTIGVLCLLLSFASFAFHGLLVAHTTAAHETNPPNTFLALGLILLGAAFPCFKLDKQQRQQSAREILVKDQRPPVLFLRSCQSDAARIKSKARFLLPFYPNWTGRSFEELLAPALGQHGPFIGLGNPEDYLPTLGAAKVYERDERWQETASGFIRRARIVIIMEGETPGLRWELSHVRQQCNPRRVFLLTPTASFPRERKTWPAFCRLLMAAGFDTPAADVGAGAIVGFDDAFRPYLLRQRLARASAYAEAISEWHELPQAAIPTSGYRPCEVLTSPPPPEQIMGARGPLTWLERGKILFIALLYFVLSGLMALAVVYSSSSSNGSQQPQIAEIFPWIFGSIGVIVAGLALLATIQALLGLRTKFIQRLLDIKTR
jgi:hypothetical protein